MPPVYPIGLAYRKGALTRLLFPASAHHNAALPEWLAVDIMDDVYVRVMKHWVIRWPSPAEGHVWIMVKTLKDILRGLPEIGYKAWKHLSINSPLLAVYSPDTSSPSLQGWFFISLPCLHKSYEALNYKMTFHCRRASLDHWTFPITIKLIFLWINR